MSELRFHEIVDYPKYELNIRGEIRNKEKGNILKHKMRAVSKAHKGKSFCSVPTVKLYYDLGKYDVVRVDLLILKAFTRLGRCYISIPTARDLELEKEGEISEYCMEQSNLLYYVKYNNNNIKDCSNKNLKLELRKQKADDYIVYYISKPHCYYVSKKERVIKKAKINDVFRRLVSSHAYIMTRFKGYDENDKNGSLLKYLDLFEKSADELERESDGKINVKSSMNMKAAVKYCLYKYVGKYGLFDAHEHINQTETTVFENCVNSGLMYLKKPREYHNLYGYDYSSAYGHIMSSKELKIPTSQGVKTKLTEIPDKVKFGFYHIYIHSTNKDFNKLFGFASSNWYYYISIKHARYLIKHLDCEKDVEMTLMIDCEFNALLYDEYLTGEDIFSEWFKTLYDLKNRLKDNVLIKSLLSSAWGYLIETKRFSLNYKDAEQVIGDNDCKIEEDTKEFYKKNLRDFDCQYFSFIDKMYNNHAIIHDKNDYYLYNLRIKCAIPALMRFWMAKLAIKSGKQNKIIRIHTDGIMFKEPLDKEFLSENPHFKLEKKTTGSFKFENLNNYSRI